MEEQQDTDLWTSFLDALTPFIVPDWGDAISFLPLAVLGLVLLAVLFLALRWRAAAEINRSRVPPRVSLPPPPGVHLPGPSRWPFVLPMAAFLIFFAMAIPPRDESGETASFANLPILIAGLLVAAVALGGWLRDAMSEWRRTAQAVTVGASDHGASGGPLLTHGPATYHAAEATSGAGAVRVAGAPGSPDARSSAAPLSRPPQEPPPGVHLPGPSPWPFFAPLSLTVILLGVIFSAALVVAGIVMGAIAAIGWLRDAGHEYRQVERGHHPEPVTRDPRRVWPGAVVTVYMLVAAVAIFAIVAPNAIAVLNASPSPSGEPAASGGAGGDTLDPAVSIAAENIAFDTNTLTVPAGEPFTIDFQNREAAPHNVAIYGSAALDTEFFLGEVFTGPAERQYQVGALDPGDYYFLCSVHPNMNGTLTAQ
ncbi:MAG: cupredoxin domain-containing protein [Chloroflexi bacterium]|nr:cupredoxin domain-containing protein [Chloroflexota bacterium]